MFTYDQINEGGKLAKELLRRVQREDPRIAIVACATALVAAVKATTMRKAQVIALIDRIAGVFDGDVSAAAQGARDLVY